MTCNNNNHYNFNYNSDISGNICLLKKSLKCMRFLLNT